MTNLLARLVIASSLASTTILAAAAQTAPRACPAPPAVLSSTQPNIFSEQQEQWLGDAMADMIESEYKPVQDPAENDYLGRIAKRLLATLPPTSIQFRVVLVDSADVNGFSLAGGRVYLTRKLVANAKNEDEVASVIAHEMGHILSHQFAIETTADLKRLLEITSVSDKADIYAKFQRLVDARMTDKHPGSSGDSDEKQNEADTVAVYATAAAGYRPQAYAEFWDRMFFVDGKVGGTLSDFFGTTKPESKRLRAILKLVTALPPGCGATESTADSDFDRWHNLVVANQPASVEADVKPIAEIALTPALRMDLERLRFSRDGKYVLAQDESSISVLTRDPFKFLFRFDAEKALPAEFSPDSQHIVFHTPGLHTEEWSVPEQKLVASHELISKNDCLQTKLSPDGRTLFCLSASIERLGEWGLGDSGDVPGLLDLTVLDTTTGALLFQQKALYLPSDNDRELIAAARMFSLPIDLVPGSFSADGNVLILGASSNKIAFDLKNRVPITMGNPLKSDVNGAYAFVGSDKVMGNVFTSYSLTGVTTVTAALFSFPDGKRLKPVHLVANDLESVTGGNYVLSRKVNDYAVGLADISAERFVIASKAPSMDFWNGWLLNENADGSIVLHNMGDGTVTDVSATLSLSPLGPRLNPVISSDGRLLALSTRTHGGVWDLASGKRILQTVGFNSGVFRPDNSFFAEFPQVGKQDRGITHFEFAPFSFLAVPYKEADDMYLSDSMLQEWKPSGKKDATLIVHNIADNSVLWQRTFEGGAPAHTDNLLPGQTILSYPFKTDFAKGRIKAKADLATQAAAIKNQDKGRVIQVLDNTTGNILHEVAINVPLTYEGVSGINIVGDWLYLGSADNRTMVYALATGAQVRQLFGYVIAADSASGHICTVNRRDEAVVYDAQGQQLADFHMGSTLRFATFQKSGETSGGQLLVLTADQKVRTMEIPSAPSQPVPTK